MDLLTFTEGVHTVRLQENNLTTIHSADNKRFVPLGSSVIRHTEALFSTTQSPGHNPLTSLIEPVHQISFAPNDYGMQANSTCELLTSLMQQLALYKKSSNVVNQMASKPQLTMETLQQALSVLNRFQEDRQLLQMHQMALEKV